MGSTRETSLVGSEGEVWGDAGGETCESRVIGVVHGGWHPGAL